MGQGPKFCSHLVLDNAPPYPRGDQDTRRRVRVYEIRMRQVLHIPEVIDDKEHIFATREAEDERRSEMEREASMLKARAKLVERAGKV